jgi:hypothetical protein
MKAPITFEVPGKNPDDDGEGVSIIQAHPPRRLRRLEDEQINLSAEEVQRRHALAEQRRQEVIFSTKRGFCKLLVIKISLFLLRPCRCVFKVPAYPRVEDRDVNCWHR